ncbi:hypothetical protein [Stackebrandtia soli]|uniref:hypothetical protein n=1 Tax=Stackebrandtia soli TaxID=1892856 RepID=UPI0039E818A6
MSVITFTRGRVAPENVAELRSRHAALVRAAVNADMGLIDAHFGRVDDSVWGAVWRWESPAKLAAARGAASVQELAASAFSLVEEPALDEITIDDAN